MDARTMGAPTGRRPAEGFLRDPAVRAALRANHRVAMATRAERAAAADPAASRAGSGGR